MIPAKKKLAGIVYFGSTLSIKLLSEVRALL